MSSGLDRGPCSRSGALASTRSELLPDRRRQVVRFRLLRDRVVRLDPLLKNRWQVRPSLRHRQESWLHALAREVLEVGWGNDQARDVGCSGGLACNDLPPSNARVRREDGWRNRDELVLELSAAET